VAQELDVKVTEFMERTIELSHIPYLYVDASYFKVRDGVKYVNKALLVVVGVRTYGYREILGARVADAEHELTWEGIFSDLKERGLTTVDLIISDGHTGIQSDAGKCSAPHGKCATYISSVQFSEKFPVNITRRSLRP
jgi:transposase-like protein